MHDTNYVKRGNKMVTLASLHHRHSDQRKLISTTRPASLASVANFLMAKPLKSRMQHNRLQSSIKANLNQKGFTLIEVMIVVAIVGILAAIAMPAYTDYVKRGKAAEATSTLADLRVKMEQYYQDNRTYVGGPCAPGAGTVKYFAYACTVATATAYTIGATPVTGEGMTGFAFSIDQNNAKTSTFDGTTGGTCWLTKKGGSC